MQIIGIDLEDTMVGYSNVLLKLLHRVHGLELDFENDKNWDLSKSFPPGSINADQIKDLHKKLVEEEYQSMELVDPELPKVFDRLRKDFTIYIVTSSFATDDQIIRLLKSFNIPYDKLVHVHHHSEKIMDEVNIYVDDNPDLIAELAQAGKYVIVYERPWNKEEIQESSHIIKASNWEEVEKIAYKLAAEKNINHLSKLKI